MRGIPFLAFLVAPLCQAFCPLQQDSSRVRNYTTPPAPKTHHSNGKQHPAIPTARMPQIKQEHCPLIGGDNILIGHHAVVVHDMHASRQSHALPSTRRNNNIWIRRLFTKMDRFGLHKISNAVQTISALYILSCGWRAQKFQFVPSHLGAWTVAFMSSNLVQFGTGIRLAAKHRRGEPVVRNVFIGTSIAALVLAFAAFFLAPFPRTTSLFLDSNPWFGRLVFATLFVGGTVIGLDAFWNMPDLVKSQTRRDCASTRRRERGLSITTKQQKVARALGSIVPYLVVVPFNLLGLYGCCCFDRCTIMTILRSINTDVVSFYQCVFCSLAVACAALFVTLRDKRLISKRMELGLTVGVCLPVLYIIANQFVDFVPLAWRGF